MPDVGENPETLTPGTKVDVRQRFQGHWARGFVVARVESDGYIVRRPSDNAELPVPIPFDDVRPEKRRQGMWWA